MGASLGDLWEQRGHRTPDSSFWAFRSPAEGPPGVGATASLPPKGRGSSTPGGFAVSQEK